MEIKVGLNRRKGLIKDNTWTLKLT